MMRFAIVGPGIMAIATTLVISQGRTPLPAAANDAEAVRKMAQAYAQAFNENDAKAVAAFWTESCVYVDRESGDRTEGRKAIQTDMEKVFKEHPKVRLTLDFDTVRFLKPDVATAEGQATVIFPDQDPSTSVFSVILTRQESTWLIDSAYESNVPSPATPYDALKDLEWLVGQWRDVTEGVVVETTVRWSANRAFLLRSYRVQIGDEDPSEGTQVIGWDPRKKQIRSWSFDSDGSFDESTWIRNGEEWLIRMARTQADGAAVSGTQVLKKVNPDTITVQSIARDVDGEPMPSSRPVTVTRVIPKESEKK